MFQGLNEKTTQKSSKDFLGQGLKNVLRIRWNKDPKNVPRTRLDQSPKIILVLDVTSV